MPGKTSGSDAGPVSDSAWEWSRGPIRLGFIDRVLLPWCPNHWCIMGWLIGDRGNIADELMKLTEIKAARTRTSPAMLTLSPTLYIAVKMDFNYPPGKPQSKVFRVTSIGLSKSQWETSVWLRRSLAGSADSVEAHSNALTRWSSRIKPRSICSHSQLAVLERGINMSAIVVLNFSRGGILYRPSHQVESCQCQCL